MIMLTLLLLLLVMVVVEKPEEALGVEVRWMNVRVKENGKKREKGGKGGVQQLKSMKNKSA